MTRPLALAVAITVAALLISPAQAETYRLIHALGNTEHEAGRDLSKDECETRKRDLKVVADAAGTYNERLGIGSITCLSERFFED